MRLAGQAYDSFTSPAILEEVEDVLVRPRFGASRGQVRLWLDAFLRVSRQVFPEIIPGGDPAVVGGDPDDLPVLNTAYAAAGGGAENTRDFSPGRNVYGWRFVTAYTFLRVLRRRGRSPA